MEQGVAKTTIRHILKEQRFHPYKLQILKEQKFHPYKLQMLHPLTEDDPDRRLQMCEWFSNKLHKNNRFTEECVLFRDEALFYVNGEVNRQNV